MNDLTMTETEEKAYRSGHYAMRRGRNRNSNPHHCATSRASDKYWAWFRGFDDAKAAINRLNQQSPNMEKGK